ncbi:hypothetical protein FWK35_00007164 [Aphis craccivora]
MFIFC